MKPKYLRNRKTGARFLYTSQLAKNSSMIPDNGDASAPLIEEVFVDTKPIASEPVVFADDDEDLDEQKGSVELMVGDIPLESASKKDMIEFAKVAFGEVIHHATGEDKVRARLRELLSA